MHIHGNSMAIIASDIYSAAQAERAAATQRAAKTLKKLLKSAAEIGSAATPDESLLIGRWLDLRDGENQSEDEYHSIAAGNDPECG